MAMGRRQRGIRILWRILWERDLYHHVPRGLKAMANKRWRRDLKEELREAAAEPRAKGEA